MSVVTSELPVYRPLPVSLAHIIIKCHARAKREYKYIIGHCDVYIRSFTTYNNLYIYILYIYLLSIPFTTALTYVSI